MRSLLLNLGILAKSNLMSECVERACVRWRFYVFAINLEFFSPSFFSFSSSYLRYNMQKRVWGMLEQRTPRICGARRRIMFACECHIKVKCSDNLLIFSWIFLVIWSIGSLNSHHWVLQEHFWFPFKYKFIKKIKMRRRTKTLYHLRQPLAAVGGLLGLVAPPPTSPFLPTFFLPSPLPP